MSASEESLLRRVWRIVLAVGAIVGLIASALQIAQTFRDGDSSLLLICVIVLSEAALLVAVVLIIKDRRAAKSAGIQRGNALPIAVGGTLVIITVALSIALIQGFPRQPPNTSTPPTPSSPSVRPTSQPKCVDQTGTSAACDVASSYLVTDFSLCTADAVLRQLNIDPEEQQLDLEASSVAGRCLLRPGAMARSEGATAHDIGRLIMGEVDTRFRLCLPTDEGPIVACSKAHHIELVSSARGADELSEVSACLPLARRYTERTLSDPVGELQPVLLESKSEKGSTYRCGVRSTLTLIDTVWHLGPAPLPTA